MDVGDIISLLFVAFLILSLLGGLFAGSQESEEGQRRVPRPTDIFESGGPQRPQQSSQPQRAPQERQMPTTATEWWQELTAQRSGTESGPQPRPQPQPQAPSRPEPRQPERQVATYDDAIERGEVDRAERQQRRRERETAAAGQSVRTTEQETLRNEITDRRSPIDAEPRRRRDREIGAVTARRHRAGGDILRRSLKEPETLERAFIVKEVLDVPIALREK
ncbi:MAG TPA: hypothetical protein VGR22_05710 [Thermomicrobiales bacterium]|nr:hypothetical protein [Thermomicrobiales bacterium]